jgi:hypothetical protein
LVCWICGHIATSGEHLIKASDLKMFFPNLKQENPVELRKDSDSFAKKIGTAKSKHFHFPARICTQCNNVITSKYDKSWASLSQYLFDNQELKEIYLEDVWKENYKNEMLNVHLYFAKMLGCALESSTIKGTNIPLKTDSFAKAILESTTHNNLLLSFYSTKDHKFPALSDLQAEINPRTGEVIYCLFFYIVGSYAVKVAYCNFEQMYRDMDKVWHPYQKDNHKVSVIPLNKTS